MVQPAQALQEPAQLNLSNPYVQGAVIVAVAATVLAVLALTNRPSKPVPDVTPIDLPPDLPPVDVVTPDPTVVTQAVHAANPLKGVSPTPDDLLKKIDLQIASGEPSNVLYTMQTPDGAIRFRVIVRHKGTMKIGFMQTPAGVGVCYDGPAHAAREVLLTGLDDVAIKHGLQVRQTLGGRINGQSAVDFAKNV